MARTRKCAMVGVLATMLGVISVGCTPLTTYPTIEESIVNQPTYEPIPTLISEAVRHAHAEWGPAGSYPIVNLPAGAPTSLYEKVMNDLANQARIMTRADEPAIHVTEVRVRGLKGEVDLLTPLSDGRHELVTVSLERKAYTTWSVDRTRVWRVRVDDIPAPSYRPDVD